MLVRKRISAHPLKSFANMDKHDNISLMKNGFTLVELSIVLVIIGLLIGGILVAQSLIESAKVQSLVRYIGQIDVAQAQFKERYNCLPGDCLSIFSGVGNNNRTIDGSGFVGNNLVIGAEGRAFWNNLSITGFQPDNVIYSEAYTDNTDIELVLMGLVS